MTNTKKKNNENKDTDNEVEQQQKETDRRQTKDTYSKDNPQNEDKYTDASDIVYDKLGERHHFEGKNCEPFDHVDTVKNSSLHRKNKETDKKFNDQQQKGTYVYVEMEIRRTKDTYSRDNPQNEDTYADAPDGVYDEPGNRRHIEEKNCESFDHVDTAKNISAGSNEATESKESTIMLNSYPKSHDQSKSSGYESVEMDGETPVLLSKSNGNEHADADFVKQHNENYLRNQIEEDEKGKNSHGSHQHVEYAQVDEIRKLKNKSKQTDTDQETVEIHQETTFESEEMHAKTDVHDENFEEPKMTKSSASSADTKQKENKIAETRQGIHERSDRTVDNAEYFDTASHLESVASSEDTMQKENKNAEVRLGINERSGRTVENTEYFDTTTHFDI